MTQETTPDLRGDYQALRRKVRSMFEERRDSGIWPKNKAGKLTKAADAQAFDWLLGIHIGLTLSGSANGLGPVIFLASVRGVDDATTIRD